MAVSIAIYVLASYGHSRHGRDFLLEPLEQR